MRSTYFAHGGRRRHRQDLIFPIRHRLIAFAVGNCFLYTSYNHPIWIIKETMLKAVAYLSYAWVVQLHRHRLNLRNLDREFLLGFSFVGCACILLEIQPSVSSLSLSLSLFFFFTNVSNTFNREIVSLSQRGNVVLSLPPVKLLLLLLLCSLDSHSWKWIQEIFEYRICVKKLF